MENNFKTRARIILQLGDQLIKNENIAVLELIKNAYDADASEVTIFLKNVDIPDKGEITIIDNGEGMDISVIKKAWLELGSNYKEELFNKGVVSKKYNRLPIGEKGIGRFGVHKLGKQIEITTRKKNQKEIYFTINWDDFNKYKYLEDTPVIIKEREPKKFTGNKTGTEIKITNLRTSWDRSMVRRIYRSSISLNSPFEKLDSFKVKFLIDSDKKDWLEGLISWDEIKNYSLYWFKCTLAGNTITEFEYKFRPWKSLTKVHSRTITEKDKFIKEQKKMVHIVKELDHETGNYIKVKKEINLSNFKIGEVRFEGYIFDLDPAILSQVMDSGRGDLKKYLNDNGGIKIYRDNIKINEYGEKGNDWLNLDIKRVNIPGKKISNNLILSTIDLFRNESTDLIEKTNREGFVENEAFHTFANAILYALNLVETLRNIDKSLLREAYNNSSALEPVIDTLSRLRISVEENIKDEKIKAEFNSYIEKIDKEYKEISEVLLTSASAGLSASIILHELEKIIKELNLVLKDENVTKRTLKLAKHLSDLVKGYGDIIRQSKYGEEDLKNLIKGALFNIEYRCENHNIELINDFENYKGNTIIKCSKRLILSSIMNIIDNSIYWLEFKKKQIDKVENFQKKIIIKLLKDKSEPHYIKLLIADNGKGYTIPIDRLTKPFISEKEDGMGLGLHITNEVMKAHNGKLEFPEYGDFELPKDFKKGAKTLLSFELNKS